MDDQVAAGAFVCAIPKVIFGDWLLKRFIELRCQLTETITFLKPGIEPEDADHYEHCVEMIIREQARSFDEWCFNSVEPPKMDAMPVCGLSRAAVPATPSVNTPRGLIGE